VLRHWPLIPSIFKAELGSKAILTHVKEKPLFFGKRTFIYPIFFPLFAFHTAVCGKITRKSIPKENENRAE
jgi:hypothetical protein